MYSDNPFYVIRADLVFIGPRMSFHTQGKAFETWALMISLASYTVLLAATACVLIRLGNLWEDVRTILHLVVVMFLATSVTFDDTLAFRTSLGVACYVLGLVFAVGLSEALLRELGLPLPWRFRAPYCLILVLFFLAPVGLELLLTDPENAALQWALSGFSPLAGLCFPTLLPAVRRGWEPLRATAAHGLGPVIRGHSSRYWWSPFAGDRTMLFFRAEAGSGLVIQGLARRQPPPRRFQATRMAAPVRCRGVQPLA